MKLFILVIVCLFASGCEESINANKLTKNHGYGPADAYEQKIVLDTQIVETISKDKLIGWIQSHKHIIIDSMASITVNNGYLVGYMVVYRETTPKNVEKTARDIALDKLSDADKVVLNLKELK